MTTVSCLFGKGVSLTASIKMRHRCPTLKKELANKCRVWYTSGVNRDIFRNPAAVFFP